METLYNNNQVNNRQAINLHLVISNYHINNYNQIVQEIHLIIKVLNRYKVYVNIK